MADPFFEEDKEEEVLTAETIKIGEKEYKQEDLQRLVGLGEQASELETKWDTKIDRLMPEYTRSREELKAIKEQAESEAKEKIEKKEAEGKDLDEEEKARIVRDELKKHKVVFEDDLENYYQNRRGGEKILEQTEAVVSKAISEDKPKTNTEELLTYMATTGIKNPQVAYEVMFKDKLREIEMQKLQSIKPRGIYSEEGSTAGAKTPPPVQVTKDNLGQMLDEVLTRGGGQ